MCSVLCCLIKKRISKSCMNQCSHVIITLKRLFHPACLARVVSWFAFVVAIFMAHENGDKQRPAKRRHVQGMLDETDPLTFILNVFMFTFLCFLITAILNLQCFLGKG